jgi:hypothetical protein
MPTPPTSGSGAGACARGSRDPTPSSGAATPSSDPTPSSTAAAETTEATQDQGTNVIEIEDDVVVGAKRKLKSHVWKEFKKYRVAGVWKAECSSCNKQLSSGSKSSTNHLRGRLKICESRIVTKGLQQSTLKFETNKDGAVVLEKYVFDHDVARKELALMICVHEYPLSIVDHAGFRKFYAALQPLFKVVSRNTIRKDILDMYEVQKRSMVKNFQQEQSRIAVTTNMWTKNHQKKGYMAVTVHYIDDDWKLKSYLLR